MNKFAALWLCSLAMALNGAAVLGQEEPYNPLTAAVNEYAPPKALVHIFQLKEIEAEPLAETVKQLFPEGIKATAYPKTNMLIVIGTPQQIQEVEKLVAELETKVKKQKADDLREKGQRPGLQEEMSSGMFPMGGYQRAAIALSEKRNRGMSPTGYGDQQSMGQMMGNAYRGSGQSGNVDELKNQYTTTNKQSIELASTYRAEAQKRNADDPRLKELQKQLQETVTKAFDYRQKRHSAEIAKLEQKIQKMKDLLALRGKIKSEIIERRVADLKNPARQWDESQEETLSVPVTTDRIHFLRGGALHVRRRIQGAVLKVPEKQVVSTLQHFLTGLWLPVEISVGSEDGVKLGTKFTVNHEGTEIGQLEVVGVQKYRSITRIISLDEGKKIAVGDRVVLEQALADPATGEPVDPMMEGYSAFAQGSVLAISEEHQMVEVSLGVDDGLTQNTILHVWRDEKYLGELKVVEVLKDRSVARIDKSKLQAPIQRGDIVGTRIPTGVDDSKASSEASTPQSVQIHLSVKVKSDEEAVAHMVWTTQDRDPSKVILLPTRINVPMMKGILFELGNVPGRGSESYFGTFSNLVKTPGAELFAKHNSVTVQFTDEDLDQARSGNLVTKVFYLPDPKDKELAIGTVEVLASTRLDPGKDPVQEAEQRGEVLGVLRLGNRESDIGENEDWYEKFLQNSLKSLEAEREQVKQELIIYEETVLDPEIPAENRAQMQEKIATLKNQLAAVEKKRELYRKELPKAPAGSDPKPAAAKN